MINKPIKCNNVYENKKERKNEKMDEFSNKYKFKSLLFEKQLKWKQDSENGIAKAMLQWREINGKALTSE